MYFTTILTPALLAASALAAPVVETRQSTLCANTALSPQCCATNVLDLADLNCAAPNPTPANVTAFVDECAALGQQAQCCLLPILEQGVVCETVNPA